MLPPGAHDLYYRDKIGNVSTSTFLKKKKGIYLRFSMSSECRAHSLYIFNLLQDYNFIYAYASALLSPYHRCRFYYETSVPVVWWMVHFMVCPCF